MEKELKNALKRIETIGLEGIYMLSNNENKYYENIKSFKKDIKLIKENLKQ